jgi:pyrroloquinoline quinone (PQQ) biosynthesis protein C
MAMSGAQFVEWLDKELEPLRQEAAASPYYDAWCSGKLSKEQLFELMKQRYANIRENPGIIAAWIAKCTDIDIRQKYIDYLHEEAPHPEYLIDFARDIGRDPEEMRHAELIPEFTTPYFYHWLLGRHMVEFIAANNFGNERTNTRNNKRMYEATRQFYPYPSLLRLNKEHSEEEGGHAELGHYILERLATTDETQRKATSAAKKSLQLKIIGQNGLYERFVKNWQSRA